MSGLVRAKGYLMSFDAFNFTAWQITYGNKVLYMECVNVKCLKF